MYLVEFNALSTHLFGPKLRKCEDSSLRIDTKRQ